MEEYEGRGKLLRAIQALYDGGMACVKVGGCKLKMFNMCTLSPWLFNVGTCGHCDATNLAGALEYCCCREIDSILRKLDGSQELCITQHRDFGSLANHTVLEQVAPLLKDRNGQTYRRKETRHKKSKLDLLSA